MVKLQRVKAKIRARVEHPFHIVKNLFKHKKAGYRGLAKNTTQLYMLFGLANLVIVKEQLLAAKGLVQNEQNNRKKGDKP